MFLRGNCGLFPEYIKLYIEVKYHSLRFLFIQGSGYAHLCTLNFMVLDSNVHGVLIGGFWLKAGFRHCPNFL